MNRFKCKDCGVTSQENELIISSVNLVRSNWAPSVTNITSLTAFAVKKVTYLCIFLIPTLYMFYYLQTIPFSV